MKAIFVVTFAIFMVAFASTTPPPECSNANGQSVVFVPNPDDCSTFYLCDRGEPLLIQCNEGLEFNPRLKVCDWPKKTVACKRQPSASTPPATNPTTTPPATNPTTTPPATNPTTTPETVTASPDMAPVEVTV